MPERLARRRRTAELESARDILVSSAWTTVPEKALLASISLETHRRDTMFEAGAGRHYLEVGLSALRALDHVVGKSRAPRSILDFACGYGRVLRFLCKRYPGVTLTACEIDPIAVDYCARTFGVHGALSHRDFRRVSLPDRFDLIWCGSLITHVDEEAAGHLLAFLGAHLTDRGRCVLSSHGETTRRALLSGPKDYGLSAVARAELLAAYEATGYGYASYEGHARYGVSIATTDKLDSLAERAGLTRISVQERGWDDHHDVHAFGVASG